MGKKFQSMTSQIKQLNYNDIAIAIPRTNKVIKNQTKRQSNTSETLMKDHDYQNDAEQREHNMDSTRREHEWHQLMGPSQEQTERVHDNTINSIASVTLTKNVRKVAKSNRRLKTKKKFEPKLNGNSNLEFNGN